LTIPVRRYPTLDSSNEEARRLCIAGKKGPLWVIADQQTSGRGRRGRSWVSQKGNLFASLLLTDPLPLDRRAQLSFAAALAAADCASAYADPVKLKWPNDVLLAGRKLGGVLLESSAGGEFLIVGIGLNLKSFPEDVEFPAIAIATVADRAPTPEQAVNRLTASWDRWFAIWRRNGFAPLRDAWLARAAGLGDKIKVRIGEAEMHGTFEDVDENGALVLRRADGSLSRIHAGEVFFRG
jgi:BirA family biotin operon repressor/biotin-[acetyl-CoA-carboxylase] ligase